MEKGLILVGAGPGDPDLITVKGIKAIQRAEVILYDALISPELLDYAPRGCQKIFVGKRAGTHSMAQSAINSLIIKYARNTLVVRLKGGDPFVFGRGYEEMSVAMDNGIEVELIPGVTSAISAPAAAGIPITTRGVSRSFWVVTATSTSNELSDDLKLACQSSATLVIMMGIKKLRTIVHQIRMHRSDTEPMAIIQNATCDDQTVVTGTSKDILEKFNQIATGGPGIIVVGKVIEESKSAQMLVEKVKQSLKAA